MNPMKHVSPARIASPLLAGLIYAFILMAAATVLISLLLLSGDGGEESLPTYAYGIHALALLSGSFVSGKRAGRKGWYFGGILGLLYGIIVLAIGFLSFDRGLDLQTLAFIAAAFLIGAVGGIMGVNTRK